MKAAVIDVGRVTVESLPDPTPEPREVVVSVAVSPPVRLQALSRAAASAVVRAAWTDVRCMVTPYRRC